MMNDSALKRLGQREGWMGKGCYQRRAIQQRLGQTLARGVRESSVFVSNMLHELVTCKGCQTNPPGQSPRPWGC